MKNTQRRKIRQKQCTLRQRLKSKKMHVEEQPDGLEDGEEEEGSESSNDVQDEHIEEEEQQEPITPTLRRSIRQQNPIDRYSPSNFLLCIFFVEY